MAVMTYAQIINSCQTWREWVERGTANLRASTYITDRQAAYEWDLLNQDRINISNFERDAQASLFYLPPSEAERTDRARGGGHRVVGDGRDPGGAGVVQSGADTGGAVVTRPEGSAPCGPGDNPGTSPDTTGG